MKGKENKENSWRRMLVGVFAVSLFVAFTTGGLALNPQPLPPTTVAIESNQMMFADGSIAKLEAHALYPPGPIFPSGPVMPIMGIIMVLWPPGPVFPSGPCMAMITNGTITSTMQEDGSVINSAMLFGQYPPTPVCSAHELTGTFNLLADTTGSISLENSDGAIIASGTGTVKINNPPTPTPTPTPMPPTPTPTPPLT